VIIEGLCRAAEHFSTLRVLAALPENQLTPDGAQTCFPAGAPLRRLGGRKISNAVLPETFNNDALVKSLKNPSPSMGEG